MILLDVHLIGVPDQTWHSWPDERPLAELAGDALGMERRIRKGVNVIKERARYTQICHRIEHLTLALVQNGKAAEYLCWPGGVVGDERASCYIVLLECAKERVAREIGAVNGIVSASITTRFRRFVREFLANWKFAYFPPRTLNASRRRHARRTIRRAYRAFWHPASTVARLEAFSERPSPLGVSFFPPGLPVFEQSKLFSILAEGPTDRWIPGLGPEQLEHYAIVIHEKAEFYAIAESKGLAVVETITMPNLPFILDPSSMSHEK